MSAHLSLPINEDLFHLYSFYVALLVLKSLLMIPITGFTRVYHGAPANTEDNKVFSMIRKSKTNRQQEEVERTRRAHLNDLENIPFFIIICFLYILLTNPSVFWATWLIRTYTVSRILYSIFYVFLKSSVRIFIYQIGILINLYLTFTVLAHYL